jgi:AraC-like DNA-binding protein
MGRCDYQTRIRLAEARDYIAANFDQRIYLSDIAYRACLSPYHFHRLYSSVYGESPHAFVSRIRIARAESLLRTSGLSIGEICKEVGFESQATFSRRFSLECGYAPTDFRRVFAAPDIWLLKVAPACMLWRYAP